MTSRPAASSLPPTPARLFLALLVANLLVRAALLPTKGYVWDVGMYGEWALAAARDGLATVYEGTSVDYPPVFLYLLYVVGKLHLLLAPGDGGPAWLLTALVKLPHLAFDLLLAWLLQRLVARHGYWGGDAPPGLGRTAALLYLWNPAVLWNSGWWGQPDGIHSALALAALAAAAAASYAWGGALLAAAALMKPLAAPLVPLLAVSAVLRRRWRGLLAVATGGLAATLGLFLPFVVTGRVVPVLGRVLGDLNAMPYASVNANNLWWLLGPSRGATSPWIGPLSPQFIGMTIFLAAYAALLARAAAALARGDEPPADYGARLCLLGAAVSATFFFLTTHMHENHLFLAIPLLLAAAGRSRRVALLFAGASIAVFLNGVLHDIWLPSLLPGVLAAPSPYSDPHIHRTYTWLQIAGSSVNAVWVGAVALGTYVTAWRAAGPRAD